MPSRLTPSGRGRRAPFILGVAKAQDRVENAREQGQANAKPGTLAKVRGHGEADQNRHDEIDDWDEAQNDPPDRFAGDLKQDDDVVDGNNCGPTRFSGLFE